MIAKTHRNSPARAQMLAKRAAEQRSRTGGFTPMASKARLSTRGARGETFRTKRWTPSRWRDLPDQFWVDCDVSSGACFRKDARRLQAHIELHPNDSCARAALAHITI